MRLRYTIGLIALCLGAVLWPTISQATHVRAGEITTRRVPGASLTYEITLTTYFDEVTGKAAADDANSYTFCFGDGTQAEVRRSTRRYINGRTSSVNTYITTHTYAGPNAFTIGVLIPNRNKGTVNLPPPASSDQLTFYVSTTILINAALQVNSTPVMLNPPLDSARVGQKFCHNPAAFDADGDSLAYRLSIPQEGITNSCRSRAIPAYLDPASNFSTTREDGSRPATFSIDSRTGDLCWDAPGQAGQFNFAFIVEEWRNGVLIGEITRDMQIIVVDQPNKRPLIVGAEICVEAGTLIQQAIRATDPDGQRVIITGFGGPLNVNNDGLPLPVDLRIPPDYARLVNGGVALAQPATATFTWQTNCNQARSEPYDITLKVNDVPGRGAVSLVSFATLRIRLYAPSVKNLTARPTATTAGRAIQLNWSAYTCGRVVNTGGGNDTTKLIIYRKEGCTPIQSQSCTTGLDPRYGYQEIAQVPYSATSYIDTSALRRGVSYSYRIVARNPGVANNGGFSVVSTEACLELPLLAPVMTQVTVDSTDTQRGQITVRWTRPLGLQPGDLGGPYQYRLQRATGLAGTDFVTVATINTALQAGAADTVYVDKGSSTSALNTTANAYRYRVEFYYTAAGGGLTRLDVTEAASSVRLSAAPAQRQVSLSWQASVPWSNDNQKHDVYRSRSGPAGPFNKIAEVQFSGGQSYSFTDTGTDTYLADGNTSRVLSADSSYCYRVMTRGAYTDARLSVTVRGPLTNYSQIICATPSDTTRPCAPRLGLDSLNCASLSSESLCNQTSFTNKLRWTPTTGPTCDPNVVGYKLYYGRYEQDTPGELVSIPAPTTSFEHSSLTTVAGCYYVTAVSRSGVESLPSNRVCNDACPLFVLPNVFTPNGDGKNDVFAALSCPRFVEGVGLVVYNRYGSKVYEGSSAVLAWNGKSSDGTDLPSGLYYYQVSVRYGVLDREAPAQILKGWVQILREGVSMR